MDDFTTDELGEVSQTVREKIERISHRVRAVESDFRIFKAESDQELFEVQNKLDGSVRNLESVSKTNEELKIRADHLESDRNERVRQLHDVESIKDKALCEKSELIRKLDVFESEKTGLTSIIERKDAEIERQQNELRSFNERINSLLTEKCRSQLAEDEIKSQHSALEYREKRFQQDKELLESEKQWYSDEIERVQQQLFANRQQINTKSLQFETDLNEKADELSQVRSLLDDSKSRNEQLTSQVEDLNNRLKETSDNLTETTENYERELQCQTNLVDVYKKSASESEGKIEEMAQTIEQMEQMYETAKQSHFAIQEELELIKSNNVKEIENRDETEKELRDELEKANELLRSKHRVMLTDEEVAALSPGAAAASRLIKGGFSLTGIYRDHSKVVEELEQQKVENKRLEHYFAELVKDIESKAPLLKQQRDDYYRLLDVNANLREQLSQVDKEQQKLNEEKDSTARQLTYTKVELERFQRDCVDLSGQVRQLVQCIEQMRRGEQCTSPDDDTLPTAEDLYLFRNIDELQSVNHRLQSALREAEARREEMVAAAQEAEMAKVRGELEIALNELQSFKDHREKQNTVIESVCRQRDTYKRLLQEKTISLEENSKPAEIDENRMLVDVDSKCAEKQNKIDLLEKEFETYRNEKNEVQKILQEKIEKLQNSVTEMRSTNSKLDTELSFKQEQFKILQNNSETSKREMDKMNERIIKTTATASKHEERANQLVKELLTSQEHLSKFKVESQFLQSQLEASRSAEHKLRIELEVVKKNARNDEKLTMTLQELQTRVDRVEAEKTLQLQRNVDMLTNERDNLQKMIATNAEQQQDYMRDAKAKLNDSRAKLDEAETNYKSIEKKLCWTAERLKESEERTISLQVELNSLKTNNKESSTTEGYQIKAQQLQDRLNKLEMEYHLEKKKCVDAENKLTLAEDKIKELLKTSETMEKTLNEQKTTDKVEGQQMQSQIKLLLSQLEVVGQEAKKLQGESTAQIKLLKDVKERQTEKEGQYETNIKNLGSELENAKTELLSWQNKEQLVRSDRDQQSLLIKNYQERCSKAEEDRETAQTLLESANMQIADMEIRVEQAKAKIDCLTKELEQQKATREQLEIKWQEDVASLNAQSQELQQKNDTLYEKTQNLANQVTIMERVGGEGEATDVVPTEESMSSMVEVVRFLRDEKLQYGIRAEVAEAEVRKLKSRETLLEEQLAQEKIVLETAEQKASEAATALEEKSRLAVRLQTLEAAQDSNKKLMEEKEQLEYAIQDLKTKIGEKETSYNNLMSEKLSSEKRLGENLNELSSQKQEIADWQQRHHDLMEQRSKFDPELVNKLRQDLEAATAQQQVSTKSLAEVNKRLTDEILSLKTQIETFSEENSNLKSNLSDMTERFERESVEKDRNAKILNQARQLARKYKLLSETQAKTITAQLETIEQKTKEIEELKSELEKAKSAVPAAGQQQQDQPANPKMQFLFDRLKNMEKKQKISEEVTARTGEKVLELTREKNLLNEENQTLRRQLEHVEAEKTKIAGENDESKLRLNSLTNMHNLCEPKYEELQNRLNALQEEKSSLERQLSVLTSKVQPVSAMVPERPGSSSCQEPRGSKIRATRPFSATVASVRPLGAQRTGIVQPSSVSPGPAQPDQSSSAGVPAQASVAPIMPMVSTSQQPSTSSARNTAFVTPQQNQNDVVSGSGDMDNFAAISSSSNNQSQRMSNVELVEEELVDIEQGEAAATVSSIDQSRKRPTDAQSDIEAKRMRTSPQEQVSTSDQSVENEAVIGHVDQQESAESTLSEIFEEQHSIPDNEPDGIDEPEDYEEQEAASMEDEDDDDDIEVLDTVPPQQQHMDMSNSAGIQHQLTSRLRNVGAGHMNIGEMRSLPNEEGDDGIVPGTPTIMGGRNEVDTSSVHVPAGVQFAFVEEQQSNDYGLEQVSESGMQRSVPTSPNRSPHDMESDSNGASSTVAVTLASQSAGQQQQPTVDDISGDEQPLTIEEEEGGGGSPAPYEEDEGDGADESEDVGREEGSEAVSLEQQDRDDTSGQDEEPEPSTSQQKRIHIKKPKAPIVWDITAESSSQQPTSSSSSSSGAVRGRQTARRARGWGRKDLKGRTP